MRATINGLCGLAVALPVLLALAGCPSNSSPPETSMASRDANEQNAAGGDADKTNGDTETSPNRERTSSSADRAEDRAEDRADESRDKEQERARDERPRQPEDNAGHH